MQWHWRCFNTRALDLKKSHSGSGSCCAVLEQPGFLHSRVCCLAALQSWGGRLHPFATTQTPSRQLCRAGAAGSEQYLCNLLQFAPVTFALTFNAAVREPGTRGKKKKIKFPVRKPACLKMVSLPCTAFCSINTPTVSFCLIPPVLKDIGLL